MNTRLKLLYWVPAAVWASGIFWLSSLQHIPDIGPEFSFKDKVGHSVLYWGLGMLVAWALRRGHNFSLVTTLWLTIVISSAYGATDEWHQYFVPYRNCDAWDWASDVAGSASAAAVFFIYESKRFAGMQSAGKTDSQV